MSTDFLRNSKRETNILIRKLDDHFYGILENDSKGLTNIPIRLLNDHKIHKDFDQNYLQELDDHEILTAK